MPQPTFETARLKLRPFTLEDAPEVQRLAGAKEIAATTLNIPHPYEDGLAEKWISDLAPSFEIGSQAVFAITGKDSGQLLGAIGIVINRSHQRAEMGYWVGYPYWNQGICSEAARAVLRYGFEELDLNRIYAYYMKRNVASGRVMQKVGMSYEGTLRQHSRKWETYEDLGLYSILKSEWRQAQQPSEG